MGSLHLIDPVDCIRRRSIAFSQGREGRDKFGRPKEKGGGTSNETKIRNKPFMLTKNAKKSKTSQKLSIHVSSFYQS